MSPDFIVIDNVSKSFVKDHPPAIHNINLRIKKGGIIGLAGPDGAGKTTLIRLIAGLLMPSEGTITVDGMDTIKDAEKIHFTIGYMPQRFGLYEDLTVLQNLNLYADLQGLVGKQKEEAFKRLLDFTRLAPFQKRKAKDLSGGMKQKLGLACALMRKPPLLLLDEPSVGVDPLSRRELWEIVLEMVKEGITVLWSTSYLDEAEKCDSVILLNEGSVLFYGPASEVTDKINGKVFRLEGFQGNRRMVVRKILSEDNVVDGVVQGKDIRIVVKEKKEPPFDLSKVGKTPELRLSHAKPRFEDGFIEILGGGPGGESALADSVKQEKTKGRVTVEAKNLTKKFGNFTAASHISFTAHSGEIFGLLGPNGAGKSTTFKMMCGLLKPTEGTAFVNGVNLQSSPSEARSHLGYMSQKFSLYGSLTVKQNLEFFSGIYNLKGSARREAVGNMIEIFDFKPHLDEPADEIPLGFKQRLALSCAVMHQPEVLFLDEPTSGVDPITRREFWNHINGLVEKGTTVVVTTHFMDEAEYCDHIGLIYNSQLIKEGSPDQLKELAKTKENPFPTLEDAFIKLIEEHGEQNVTRS